MNVTIGKLYSRRIVLWGAGRLKGTAIILDGSPADCIVVLYPQPHSANKAGPMDPLLATTSGPGDAAWAFKNLDQDRRYTVIAFDHKGDFDPVMKVDLIPESME